MIGSKGRFSISAIIPFIANFFITRKDNGEYFDSPSKGTVFAQGSHSHWGSSTMDYNEIYKARRKTRRAKTFKSYGSMRKACRLQGV